jgi:hypothetical protein
MKLATHDDKVAFFLENSYVPLLFSLFVTFILLYFVFGTKGRTLAVVLCESCVLSQLVLVSPVKFIFISNWSSLSDLSYLASLALFFMFYSPQTFLMLALVIIIYFTRVSSDIKSSFKIESTAALLVCVAGSAWSSWVARADL